MPRRRRHVSRCSVAASEPNDAAPIESVPKTVPRDDHASTGDSVPYESGPSTEPNSHSSGKVSSSYWTVNLKDENGEITQARLKVNDVFVLPQGKKIVLEWNEFCQPIRESSGLFSQFLGSVVSNVENFPILYDKWLRVPYSYKEHVWVSVIQSKFDVYGNDQKKYIMQKLGKLWKDNCVKMYHTCQDPTLTWQDKLELCPDGVPLDQWAGFLGYRDRDEIKLMAARNTANRARQRIPHTLGAMTMARKRDQIEMETGRPCSRAEMYAISHKRKDGSYVSDDAREKYEELQTQTQLSSENDAYTAVFGKEHPGCVRGMGQGVCPLRMFGSSSSVGGSSLGEYIRKSDYEANMQKMIDEINLLKAEMVEMRQNMHPSRQTSNQVEDLGSPTPAQGSGNVRRSSSSSHEPHN